MSNRRFHKVAVLMGGWSAEREVSLSSGKGVVAALESLGYAVEPIDAGRDIAQKLAQSKPEAVFNALHGRWGEDGCVQGVLEVLGIPYTHSGVLASALAMDKPAAKRIFKSVGLPMAEDRLVSREEMLSGEDPLPRPYVIKPVNEGSSVGVTIVRDGDNDRFGDHDWPFGEQVMVERYIPGREIQVAVLNGKALGAIEIRPKAGFYDYEAKYTGGKADHLMPAPIQPEAYAQVMRMAEIAHEALGCRGVTRSDFRYDDTQGEPGRFYILETNTQPGMTPLSLTPEIAAHAGMDYAALVGTLMEAASCGQ